MAARFHWCMAFVCMVHRCPPSHVVVAVETKDVGLRATQHLRQWDPVQCVGGCGIMSEAGQTGAGWFSACSSDVLVAGQ